MIVISDRLTVDQKHAAVASPNVYLTSTGIVRHIVGDVEALWVNLLAAAAKQPRHTLRKYVQDVLSENGRLPTQVVDRLIQHKIRTGEFSSRPTSN